MLSPGASVPPGGRMKQLFGAVVWNCKHAISTLFTIHNRDNVRANNLLFLLLHIFLTI